MKKNIIKATIYIVLGFAICLAALYAGVYMYFSATFLPVYVGKTYIIGNQIVRYELYLLLVVVAILSANLAGYGMNYLTKVFHKNVRRR